MAKLGNGGDRGDKNGFGSGGGSGRRGSLGLDGLDIDFVGDVQQTPKKNKKSKRTPKRRGSHLRGMWNQLKPSIKLSRVGGSPRLDEGHARDAPPQMTRKGTPSCPPWGSTKAMPSVSKASASGYARDSFIHSFIHSFVRLFVCLFVCLFV